MAHSVTPVLLTFHSGIWGCSFVEGGQQRIASKLARARMYVLQGRPSSGQKCHTCAPDLPFGDLGVFLSGRPTENCTLDPHQEELLSPGDAPSKQPNVVEVCRAHKELWVLKRNSFSQVEPLQPQNCMYSFTGLAPSLELKTQTGLPPHLVPQSKICRILSIQYTLL